MVLKQLDIHMKEYKPKTQILYLSKINSKCITRQLLTRMPATGTYALLMGMLRVVTLEDSLVVLDELHVVLYQSNHTLKYSSNCFENSHPHKNLHTNTYRSCIRNYPKLETTKTSFNRWIDNQTVVHNSTEYFSVMKRSKLPSHEKRDLKSILLSERSPPEKATFCTILIILGEKKKGNTARVEKSVITKKGLN